MIRRLRPSFLFKSLLIKEIYKLCGYLNTLLMTLKLESHIHSQQGTWLIGRSMIWKTKVIILMESLELERGNTLFKFESLII